LASDWERVDETFWNTVLVSIRSDSHGNPSAFGTANPVVEVVTDGLSGGHGAGELSSSKNGGTLKI